MAASADSSHLQQLYKQIRAVIRKIPRGKVATYGQVAELAGVPRGGRIAAAALKTSKASDGLPWQRVIGKRGPTTGRIAIHDPVGAAVQRELLEREGVDVGDRGAIDLKRYAYAPPKGAGPRPKAEPRRREATSRTRGSPRRR
ncbi:MAG TPA: MGMT family protein [Kofleriaceae bacterium]|nr:MGMT family protein [Kofleriaceae bacterium]